MLLAQWTRDALDAGEPAVRAELTLRPSQLLVRHDAGRHLWSPTLIGHQARRRPQAAVQAVQWVPSVLTGVARTPSVLGGVYKSLRSAWSMVQCRGAGCTAEVTKEGHYLCYSCWRKQNGKGGESAQNPSSIWASNEGSLTATKIGEHFGVSGQEVNLLLNELGWMYKPRHGKGWKSTKQGRKQGARPAEVKQSGVPYVLWPEKILSSRALRRAVADFNVADFKGEDIPAPEAAAGSTESEVGDFRKKFPANYRCMDGHCVRSRAEAMIDNWLYTNNISHAYERKLPIEEDVYSDFFIRTGNVYIEFWGMESDEKYARRKAVKQRSYRKNGFNLIELNDENLNNLDDVLTRKLLKFNVRVD